MTEWVQRRGEGCEMGCTEAAASISYRTVQRGTCRDNPGRKRRGEAEGAFDDMTRHDGIQWMEGMWEGILL